jgi:hypothetical protein
MVSSASIRASLFFSASPASTPAPADSPPTNGPPIDPAAPPANPPKRVGRAQTARSHADKQKDYGGVNHSPGGLGSVHSSVARIVSISECEYCVLPSKNEGVVSNQT